MKIKPADIYSWADAAFLTIVAGAAGVALAYLARLFFLG